MFLCHCFSENDGSFSFLFIEYFCLEKLCVRVIFGNFQLLVCASPVGVPEINQTTKNTKWLPIDDFLMQILEIQ